MDKIFGVANIVGTIENISPNLKTNIVVILELQDRNGVKIENKEIKITSLAPSQKYKIDEIVWNNEVKLYKIHAISAKYNFVASP